MGTQFSASLSAAKDSLTLSATDTKSVDMAGDEMIASVQGIGLATEQLALGDVTTLGYIFVKNLDETNFVEIGLNTPLTQKVVKLRPGEFAFFPPATAALYALADTAPVLIQILAVEL